jgi:hypothetical protein
MDKAYSYRQASIVTTNKIEMCTDIDFVCIREER